MKLKYDKELDTKHIQLKKGKIVKTEEREPWLLFDLNENDEVLAIEILEASIHPLSVTTIGEDLYCYGDVLMNVSDKEEKRIETLVKLEPSYIEDNILLETAK